MNNQKETIVNLIGQSQDGKKLNNDVYSNFLKSLIEENTNEYGYVDADELRDNLRYAIHEFNEALKSIEQIAERVKDLKEYQPDPNAKYFDGTDLINEILKS